MIRVKSKPNGLKVELKTGVLVSFNYHGGVEPNVSVIAVVVKRDDGYGYDLISLDGNGEVWTSVKEEDFERWEKGESPIITNFQYLPHGTVLEYLVEYAIEDDDNDNT